MLFPLTVTAILVNELPRKMIRYQVIIFMQWISNASESFVSSAVRMLLLSSGKFSLWLWFALQIFRFRSHKAASSYKRFWFISLFSAQVQNSTKLFKIFRNAKHLCFNALSDYCTIVDTISFISWLPEKVSHTMLRMAKNLNAEYKQWQTKYRFFYFSNEANNKINQPMLENSRVSNSRVFIGVFSKFSKLKTSVFLIAGERFIRWICSLSNLCLTVITVSISIILHIFWIPANEARKTCQL